MRNHKWPGIGSIELYFYPFKRVAAKIKASIFPDSKNRETRPSICRKCRWLLYIIKPGLLRPPNKSWFGHYVNFQLRMDLCCAYHCQQADKDNGLE